MEYLRKLDTEALEANGARSTQTLLGRDSGSSTCEINCIKTPVGDGSPAGLHTHPFDQVFYVLSGTMSLEIDGRPRGRARDARRLPRRGVASQLERRHRADRAPRSERPHARSGRPLRDDRRALSSRRSRRRADEAGLRVSGSPGVGVRPVSEAPSRSGGRSHD